MTGIPLIKKFVGLQGGEERLVAENGNSDGIYA